MVNCKEQISLSCKNLYPKPITSCALYNDYSGSIIKVETINRFSTNKDHTFNLSVFANYDIEEIKSLNVPVSFKCEYAFPVYAFFVIQNFIRTLFNKENVS